jgi:hypothetical protein
VKYCHYLQPTHCAAEIRGLAKPLGQGLSSSTISVLRGFFNIVIGYVLLCRVGSLQLQDRGAVDSFAAGALAIALLLAVHFGRFNGGNEPKRQ